MRHSKDHFLRRTLLVAMTIDFQPQREVAWIRHFIRGYQPGSHGSEGVVAFTLHPLTTSLQLISAFGKIVDDAITSHMSQGVRLGDVARSITDHHSELHFPVGLF